MNAQLQLGLIPHIRARRGTFYVTTPLTVAERNAALASAAAQDDRVLAVYRAARRPLTPSEVHQQLEACGYHCPIVSIRRAINTLTAARVLVKLITTKQGPWGAKEHEWSLPAGTSAA